MRTTLTLDDDLAVEIRQAAHRAGTSFKDEVNETLRAGLRSRRSPPRPRRYRLEPVSLGGPVPGVDLDKALRLADALEDGALAVKLLYRQ